MIGNEKQPKAIYVARNDGQIYLVIAEDDGSFRRWLLSPEQNKKLARETLSIALN